MTTTLPYLTPLAPDVLAERGIPPIWRYGMADRVRFPDLDALGHVNNARYLSWFEAFRLSYLRDYAISDYAPGGPRLVLAQTGLTFHAEMFLDETYILTARTAWFRTSSFLMEYGVFAPDLRVTGEALVVLRQPDGSGKWPLSDANRRVLAERDGAVARA